MARNILGKCPGGPMFNIVYNEENLKKNVLETLNNILRKAVMDIKSYLE